jgi:hypothetical protein
MPLHFLDVGAGLAEVAGLRIGGGGAEEEQEEKRGAAQLFHA